MFFKRATFKKILTEAWKGCGLTIGNNGGLIFLSGEFWIIWLEEWGMSNKVKAIIVEMCGEIPEPGVAFMAHKDTPNQYAIEDNPLYHMPEFKEDDKTVHPYVKTGIVIAKGAGAARLYQDEKAKEIMILNEIFAELTSPQDADLGKGEEGAKGPYLLPNNKDTLFWHNDRCALCAFRVAIPEDSGAAQIVAKLEGMDLSKI